MIASRAVSLLIGAAAVGLVASLWLPWFDVPRPAELGPDRVNGWEAFSRLDAAIAGAAVLALLAPLALPRPVARLLGACLGAAAAVFVADKLARLTLVPPLSLAPQEPSSFLRAERALIGPYLALVAAVALAGLSAFGARRSAHRASAGPRRRGSRWA